MNISLLFILSLHLVFNNLFCQEGTSRALNSSLKHSPTVDDFSNLTSSPYSSDDDDELVKMTEGYSTNTPLLEEDDENILPTIPFLLNSSKESREDILEKLPADQTNELLELVSKDLDQKYREIEASKKILAISRKLMFRNKTPFELLNHRIDEQAAVVAAAQKQLEELEEQRIEAENTYTTSKKKAEDDCKITQNHINVYNAVVNLQEEIHNNLYTRAKKVDPIVQLAQQKRQEEELNKTKREEQQKRVEASKMWLIISKDESLREEEEKLKKSSDKPNTQDSSNPYWIDEIGNTVRSVGETVGYALVTGGNILKDSIS